MQSRRLSILVKIVGYKLVGVSVEMEIRREKGEIDDDVILLTVEDPKGEVGSGGATLNALLVVAEYISAKQGYTV